LKELKVLIVEDSERDAALLVRELQRAEYSPVHTRVETAQDMKDALANREWDIILSDYVIPGFGGLAALQVLHDRKLDIPFIVVSGQIGEDVAVEAMKAGANDYIMKGNLKRLGPAIERELADAENRKKRHQAEEDLERLAAELRTLAQRLLQIQEEERWNIARELHDEIGQQMTVLKLLQERTKRALGENVPSELNTAQEMVTKLTNQVRSMSLRLRPGTLDDLGLLPTLESHLKDFSANTGIQVDFKQNGLEIELGRDTKIGAYRIIQESLTNIARHAKASQVTVAVDAKNKILEIVVQDNGPGFNPAAVPTNSSGLRGMRERARYLGGSFSLESAPGKGTKISVQLPLSN
jgi:two-component system, NarL family, sensor histidine kinase UhpB